MSYHDYGNYTTKWTLPNSKEEIQSERPRLQVISPQKQLYDIRTLLGDKEAVANMTADELAEQISQILNYQRG